MLCIIELIVVVIEFMKKAKEQCSDLLEKFVWPCLLADENNFCHIEINSWKIWHMNFHIFYTHTSRTKYSPCSHNLKYNQSNRLPSHRNLCQSAAGPVIVLHSTESLARSTFVWSVVCTYVCCTNTHIHTHTDDTQIRSRVKCSNTQTLARSVCCTTRMRMRKVCGYISENMYRSSLRLRLRRATFSIP